MSQFIAHLSKRADKLMRVCFPGSSYLHIEFNPAAVEFTDACWISYVADFNRVKLAYAEGKSAEEATKSLINQLRRLIDKQVLELSSKIELLKIVLDKDY